MLTLAGSTADTVTTGSGNISITDNPTGVLMVNAALVAGSTLTLTGAGQVTVTTDRQATQDSGALTVTASGTTAQTAATGSGNMSIADSAKGGSVTVDATKLGTNTLTLTGSAAETVNSLTGNVTTGAALALTVAIGIGTGSYNSAHATTVTVGGIWLRASAKPAHSASQPMA